MLHKINDMKLSLKLGLDVSKSSGGISYDTATQAVFDYASSQGYTEPSNDVKAALDSMIVSLKDAGIWSKLDILYILATDGDRDFAKINIINPGTFNCTEAGTVIFTLNEGFKSDGSTGYLNTNYTPSTDAINLSLNSASIFSWNFNVGTLANSNSIAERGNNAGIPFLQIQPYVTTGGVARVRVNTDSSGSAETTGNLYDFLHGDRGGSGSHEIFGNGVQRATSSDSSVNIPNFKMYLLASNNQGAPAGYESNLVVSVAGIGAPLNAEALDLYSAFNAYMSSL